MKHLNITVSGRVQGVFFRASSREQAQLLGINGFVRNQPDGSVYLEAEGDDEAMAKMLAWLEQGPPAARVDNLAVEESEVENLEGFVVSR